MIAHFCFINVEMLLNITCGMLSLESKPVHASLHRPILILPSSFREESQGLHKDLEIDGPCFRLYPSYFITVQFPI